MGIHTLKLSSLSILSTLLVTACSGGSDSSTPPEIAQGVFKDSNVAGLTYRSGSQRGTTDQNGMFNYEVGKEVIFSIGGVELGSATGKSVITPIDLIPNSDISTPEVQNIIGLLIHLDEDQRPGTGITISQSLAALSESWEQIDFSSTSFENQLTQINSDITTLFGARTFPNQTVRNEHFQDTLSCLHSGAYRVVNNDNVPFALTVNPLDGTIRGFSRFGNNAVGAALSVFPSFTYSFASDSPITFTSAPDIDINSDVVVNALGINLAATISGSLSSTNTFSGTWEYDLSNVPNLSPLLNNFEYDVVGTRLNPNAQGEYRISGILSGSINGVFEVYIDGSDNVSGHIFSVEEGVVQDVTGTINDTSITMQTESGITFSGSITSDFSQISGEWSFADSEGAFEGNGCYIEQPVLVDRCDLLTEGTAISVNHGSILNPITDVLSSTIGTLDIPAGNALGGLLGASPTIDLGNAFFSGRAVVGPNNSLSNAGSRFETDISLTSNLISGSVDSSIMLAPSQIANSNDLNFTCSNNVISISGNERFDGNANISLSGLINVSLNLNATSSVSDLRFRLENAPNGGLWLFPEDN